MTPRRPLLPLRLERWRVPPGWRWFRLPGYARRWDQALETERRRREAIQRFRDDFRSSLDYAIERLRRLSRECRQAAERGRLP